MRLFGKRVKKQAKSKKSKPNSYKQNQQAFLLTLFLGGKLMKSTKFYVIMLTMICTMALLPAAVWAEWTDGPDRSNILMEALSANKTCVAACGEVVEFELENTLQENDILRLTLTGGAIWCDVPDWTTDGGGNLDLFPLQGIGTNQMVWSVGADFGVGDFIAWLVDDDLFTLTDVSLDDCVDLTITVTRTVPVDGDITFIDEDLSEDQDYLFCAVNAFEVDVDEATDTASVTAPEGPYTEFIEDNGVDYTTDGSDVCVDMAFWGDDCSIPQCDGSLVPSGTILFKITGDFTGIEAVETDCQYIYGATATGAINGDQYDFSINATMDAAYAVLDTAFPCDSDFGFCGYVVLSDDPYVAQAERCFDLEIMHLGDDVFGAYTIYEGQVYCIERDGATRRLLNIPNGADGDIAWVRISNPTANAGKIYGTMWDNDGNVIGTEGTLITTLDAYATEIFNSDQLIGLFGNWDKRARAEFNGEITDMGVMGLIRTPANVLTNMSNGAPIPDNFQGQYLGKGTITGAGSSSQVW